MVVERHLQVVHTVAVVDEPSRQTHNNLVAAIEAAHEVLHFRRSADSVAIANVETQAPIFVGVFHQYGHPARDSSDAALLVDRVGGVFEVENHGVVVSLACPGRQHPSSHPAQNKVILDVPAMIAHQKQEEHYNSY